MRWCGCKAGQAVTAALRRALPGVMAGLIALLFAGGWAGCAGDLGGDNGDETVARPQTPGVDPVPGVGQPPGAGTPGAGTPAAGGGAAGTPGGTIGTPGMPGGAPGATGCGEAEAQQVFADQQCTACHGTATAETTGGGLDLEAADLTNRLMDRETRWGLPGCEGRRVIDSADPERSLLLVLTSAERHAALADTTCERRSMPQSGSFMPESAHACLHEFVLNVTGDPNGPNGPTTPGPVAPAPFGIATAESALARAKYLLHGGVPTAAELDAVRRMDGSLDATALESLVRTWEGEPAYAAKLENLLETALQQEAIIGGGFNVMLGPAGGMCGFNRPRHEQMMREIFGRTAYRIVSGGGDFREVFTTRTLEMTTAALLYLKVADTGRRGLHCDAGPLLTEAEYADWRTITFTAPATAPAIPTTVDPVLAEVRALTDGATVTLRRPMVGFFTMPSFLARWDTNDDNDFRVTTQQALIVGLDRIFDPSDTTPHVSEVGIVSEHAAPQSACYQCHRMMDPMRLGFQKAYGTDYRLLLPRAYDAAQALTPSFAAFGVSESYDDLDGLGQLLADHPQMPLAWVQKLCMWGNSQRCSATDPEVQRLVGVFTQDYDFQALIRAFVVSPLFTAAATTKSHEDREYLVSLARGNHLCVAMTERIRALAEANGTTAPVFNFCRPTSGGNQGGADAFQLGVIGPDSAARGTADWVQSAHVTAFEFKSLDARCAAAARFIVGNTDAALIKVSDGVDRALDQLVQSVMGLPPNHSRYADTRAALRELYDIGTHRTRCSDLDRPVDPVTQTDITCGYRLNDQTALRDVWFSACTSPDILGLGL